MAFILLKTGADYQITSPAYLMFGYLINIEDWKPINLV